MNTSQRRHFHLHLLLGWLLGGSALALLAPVSPASSTLGWSGLYWLLVAPGLMLLASVPGRAADQAAPCRRSSMRRKSSPMMSR